MSDGGVDRCAHPECEADLTDTKTYRDMGNGQGYCSKEHLLAHANGEGINDE